MLSRPGRLAFTLLVLGAAIASPARAQQADVIRGHVTNQQGDAIPNARIVATATNGDVNRAATSDRRGLFTITVPNGEGDYLVTVSLLGYFPKRFQLKRVAGEDILIADVMLTVSDPQAMSPVHVTALRDVVARGDTTGDISGTDRRVDPSSIAAAQMGELAAMAAALPGVLYIPGADGDPSGYSVLGLDNSQNAMSLNGLNFSGSDVPRDATITTSLAIAPYDVSTGGFSGAQLNLRVRGGSNVKSRTGSFLLDAPELQWTDPAGRELGQEYTSLSLSGLLSGAIVPDHSFYSFAYQAGRRSNDLRSLINTDPLGLEAVGVSPDSVERLRSILNSLHVPLSTTRVPARRETDQASFVSSFDIAPPTSRSGQAFNLTVLGSWNRNAPASQLSTETPAHSGEHENVNGMIQGHHSAYFSPFGFGILSETAFGLSEMRSYGEPYLALPEGEVRIASNFTDGTIGITTVAFGGSPSFNRSSQTTSEDLINQLSWFSENNRHRLKLSTEVRRDDVAADLTTNQLGTFTFNSLGDLETGRPAEYTRQLNALRISSGQLLGALALGDSWRRTNDLQFQYGIRLDGNVFEGAPPANSLVQQTFGVRNDFTPDRAYASPRIGFAWAYGTAPQIGAFDGAARIPRAVVRGGVGVFQNASNSNLLSAALSNTGLATGLQQIDCTGDAAPAPDWSAWYTHPSAIPARCANGSAATPFSSSSPNVQLFGRDYVAPRSVRSNLQWSGPALGNRFMLQVEAVYSRNQHQSDFIDLNFNRTVRFTLPSEAGRPVYVQPTSIDPVSGVIAPGDARISPLFNRVLENLSDLSSDAKQFRIGIAPASFNSSWTWSLTYVYQNIRDQTRGFVSTAGNPFDVAWGRSSLDSRHQVVYAIGFNVLDAVRLTWNGSLRSGMPYTPSVGGDLNGDGLGNDRAFIFNPAATADAALGAAMRSLLTSAPSGARDCLAKQLGTIAARNSCEGPWTSSTTLGISFNPVKFRMPQRAVLSLQLNNPLAAADLLLHGENNVRGWGQPALPDAALLYVRGFDAASQSFKYDVNQRFGSTAPQATSLRAPVSLTAMVRFDIGPTREEQQLLQSIDRGRARAGLKLAESSFKAIYGAGAGLMNPLVALLHRADSLRLTRTQSDTIALLNRRYALQLDSIWAPAARYFAALPDRYDQRDAYGHYLAARRASVDLLIRLAPRITSMLSANQRRKLPSLVAAYLDPRYLASIRSGTAGQGGAPFGTGGPMPTGAGGTGGANVIAR